MTKETLETKVKCKVKTGINNGTIHDLDSMRCYSCDGYGNYTVAGFENKCGYYNVFLKSMIKWRKDRL